MTQDLIHRLQDEADQLKRMIDALVMPTAARPALTPCDPQVTVPMFLEVTYTYD